MRRSLQSSTRSLGMFGLSAVALALTAFGAHADVLPVQNLTFNQLTNPFDPANSQKDFFNSVQPLDWSVGTAGANGTLTYVGQQGSEGFQGGLGNVYPVYTNPGFSVTVPAGTNFFQADGNPDFENTIFQTISGLTAGTTYTLQFQQAAGQQVSFMGDTTEQWKVFLGVGGIGVDCSSNPCTVTGTADNLENDSTLMNTPSQQNINWNSVTMSFTPTAAELNNGSAVLTFLAWGDGGSTTNLPPTVFLEGVNTPPTNVPEPSTWAMMIMGFLGMAFVGRRQLKKRAVATV
ncbi:MAG TPA: PEP-CTERM sorting domain-containing protein [Roseiarcus sp.]